MNSLNIDAKIGDTPLASVASPNRIFAIFQNDYFSKKKTFQVKGTRVLYESCNELMTKTLHVTCYQLGVFLVNFG